MNYSEITLTIPVDFEINKDILLSFLNDADYEGFVEDAPFLIAYIPSENFNETSLLEILQNPALIGLNITFSLKTVEEQNWNELWEKNYFEPIEIGSEILVRGSFHQAQNEFKHQIIIDPKMSFGTGHHQTTQMMLESMTSISLEGKSVMDMGCGTGILAIYAAQRGASPIVAVDIDEWSVTNTQENLVSNQVQDKIEVHKGEGSILNKLGIQFDVFLANINLGVLLYDMEVYKKHIKPGGLLLLSGFLISDQESIKEEMETEPISVKTNGEWCQMTFRI